MRRISYGNNLHFDQPLPIIEELLRLSDDAEVLFADFGNKILNINSITEDVSQLTMILSGNLSLTVDKKDFIEDDTSYFIYGGDKIAIYYRYIQDFSNNYPSLNKKEDLLYSKQKLSPQEVDSYEKLVSLLDSGVDVLVSTNLDVVHRRVVSHSISSDSSSLTFKLDPRLIKSEYFQDDGYIITSSSSVFKPVKAYLQVKTPELIYYFFTVDNLSEFNKILGDMQIF